MSHKTTLRRFTLALRQLTLAACFLILTQSSATFAQISLLQDDAFCGDCCEHDLQFFSPVDFDFDCQPIRKDCGWTFRYDKLNWAMTGERVAVGDPNEIVFSEIIYTDAIVNRQDFTTTDLTAVDLQYMIVNGLQDVAPTADFAWGERYEFGRFDGDSGWEISILDGPEVNVSNTFGSGATQVGFGSVHVNFSVPDNYLLGWRDYEGVGVETDGFVGRSAVFGGPNEGATGGDDFVDDLDGDGADGFGTIDIDGDDTIDGVVVDRDDLHLFNIRYNQLTIRNTTETQGFEMMKIYRLSNKHKMTSKKGDRVSIGYGMRFLRLRDEFSFNGVSDVLGAHFFNTSTENQLVGPQLRAQWKSQRGRWMWDFDGRAFLAYNITDTDQAGSLGLDALDALGIVVTPGLAPGGENRLISAQPTTYAIGRRNDEFSPTIELRANLSYSFTSAISARLGYTGIFVDNISRAAAVTSYSIPNPTLLPAGQQDIFINGANFGFDVVY